MNSCPSAGRCRGRTRRTSSMRWTRLSADDGQAGLWLLLASWLYCRTSRTLLGPTARPRTSKFCSCVTKVVCFTSSSGWPGPGKNQQQQQHQPSLSSLSLSLTSSSTSSFRPCLVAERARELECRAGGRFDCRLRIRLSALLLPAGVLFDCSLAHRLQVLHAPTLSRRHRCARAVRGCEEALLREQCAERCIATGRSEA